MARMCGSDEHWTDLDWIRTGFCTILSQSYRIQTLLKNLLRIFYDSSYFRFIYLWIVRSDQEVAFDFKPIETIVISTTKHGHRASCDRTAWQHFKVAVKGPHKYKSAIKDMPKLYLIIFSCTIRNYLEKVVRFGFWGRFVGFAWIFR